MIRMVIEMKVKLFLKNCIRPEIIAKPEWKLKLWIHLFISRTEIMHHYSMYYQN